MGIWTSLEPASTVVDPGASATVRLRLRNTTDLVEEYRIRLVGDPAVWAVAEPYTLRLYPGTTGSVEITFRPPRTPDAAAGAHPFAVEVTPTEQPGLKAVIEGQLTVTPFTEIRAELVPPSVRGRFRGKAVLAVDNLGNTMVTASLKGSDTGQRLEVEPHPANVQIQPGRAAWVRAKIKPTRVTWFGQRETHPFAMQVLRSAQEPMEVTGSYVQPAVMPRWLLAFSSMLVMALVAAVALWFGFQPKVSTQAHESAAGPVGNPLPVSPSPLLTPPPPPPPSSPPPHPTPPPVEKGGGGGSQPHKPPRSHGPKVLQTGAIVSYASGRCIDVAGTQAVAGSALQIWDCNGQSWQHWSFMSDGTLRSMGMCMDVQNGSSADDAPIQLYPCNGSQAQHFVLAQAADLVNVGANKCVDVAGAQTANSTRVQLWHCAGTSNQKWHLV